MSLAGHAPVMSLAGHVTVLTGATGRLGRAIAEAYCRAGSALLLTARDDGPLQALAHELGARYATDVTAVACDFAQPPDIERLTETIRRQCGGLDVLVNAAAVIGPIGPTWEVDWDDWRHAVETDLFATVRLCQLCVPLMPRSAARGKIVNLSGGGATSPRPRFSAYATAKTGVVRFTETLAQEVADRRIDVNCIAPGILNSRLTHAVVAAGPERAGRGEYDAAAAAVASDADSRERAAELALFLGSPSSDGISGRLLSAVWDDWASLRSNSSVLQDPAVYTLRRVVPTEPPAPLVVEPATVPLDVCVAGLWHLGCVTAGSLAAAGHRVIAYDGDATVVAGLRNLTLPVIEPGLPELLARATNEDRLAFTDDASAAGRADVVWVTWDTPVDDRDRPDVEWVFSRVEALFPHLRDEALVLVSSQLPAGSVAELERRCAAGRPGRTVSFACVPENLRLGRAVEGFMRPDSIVVGVRHAGQRERIATLLLPFTARIEWMGVESAEMTKHAINAFLATSIAFINEIASVCERVGADAAEVSRGLKSDHRIGPGAYLAPGAAFSGGTLARDVVALTQLASSDERRLHVIGSICASNEEHRQWTTLRLRDELGALRGRTIAIWGLTYKPGTDTLRRSGVLELCEALLAEGATVRAYDPAVSKLPAQLASRVTLAPDAVTAARRADALVVATEWPEFLAIAADDLIDAGRGPLVIDANGFLAQSLGTDPRMRYVSVGRP